MISIPDLINWLWARRWAIVQRTKAAKQGVGYQDLICSWSCQISYSFCCPLLLWWEEYQQKNNTQGSVCDRLQVQMSLVIRIALNVDWGVLCCPSTSLLFHMKCSNWILHKTTFTATSSLQGCSPNQPLAWHLVDTSAGISVSYTLLNKKVKLNGKSSWCKSTSIVTVSYFTIKKRHSTRRQNHLHETTN